MENNINLFLERKGENITEMEKIIEEQLQSIPKVWEIQIMAKWRISVLYIYIYIKNVLK